MRNKNHLHYGSLVSLKVLQKGNTYISSDGFTQKSVIAQDYSSESHDPLRSPDFLDSVFLVIPLYQYVAQQMIQQQLDEFYQEETKKFQNEINSRENSTKLEQNSLKKQEQQLKQQGIQLQSIQQELLSELNQNVIKFNKNKNEKIAYGEKFQLQHFRSKKYLCLSNQSSDDSIQRTFSLQFEANPSEMTAFKFVSAYKHQLEISKDIQFNSHVYLAIDVEKEGYIYFLNSNELRGQQLQYRGDGLKELDQPQDSRFLRDRKSDFYFKFAKQTIFEIQLYCECIEDDLKTQAQEDISTLTFGDIIWITENQSESYLECVDNIEDQMMKGGSIPNVLTSLSQYAVAKTEEEFDLKQKALQKIKPKNAKNISQLSLLFKKMQSSELKNTRGLWKLESSEMDKGGPISQKSEVRLKNIRNGLYLSFIEEITADDNDIGGFGIEQSKQNKQKTVVIEMKKQDNTDMKSTLFQLVRKYDSTNTSAHSEFLYDYLYDLKHVATSFYLGQMHKKDFKGRKQDLRIILNPSNNYNNPAGKDPKQALSNSMTEDNIIKVQDQNEVNENPDDYSKKVLAAAITISESDSKEFIKLYKAPHEEVWEILYLLSCIPQLQRGINLLKHVNASIIEAFQQDDIDTHLIRKMKQEADSLEKQFLQFNRTIQSIIQFCYDAKSSIQTNSADESKFKCNIKRQRLLREQGVLRYVTLLIKQLFPDSKNKQSPFKKALLNEDFLFSELRIFNWVDQYEGSDPMQQVRPSDSQLELKTKAIKIFKGLSKILRSCYQLIYQMCFNNSENQLEAFKYIKVYKNHIGYGVGAESCIISIMKDNEDLLLYQNFADIIMIQDDLDDNDNRDASKTSQMLLEEQLEDQLLNTKKHLNRQGQKLVEEKNKLVNIILKQYEQVCSIDQQQKGQVYEILDLLSCLCKNKAESITINQSSICDMIFPQTKKNDLFHTALIRILPTTTNQLFVENLLDPKQDSFELLEFFKKKDDVNLSLKSKQIIQKIQTFMQKQIQLYANLCAGRNYNCIEKVRRILPLKCIKSYLWIPTGGEISSALIQIADCVYIDKKPRFQRFVPDLVHSIRPSGKNQASRAKRVYKILASSFVTGDYDQEFPPKGQMTNNMNIEMGNMEKVKRQSFFGGNGISRLSTKEEGLEETFLMNYLKESVFTTIIQYLQSCIENGETRNKSLTLNTLELVRKFLTFDIVSLTSVDSQMTIYQEFLMLLQLGAEEHSTFSTLFMGMQQSIEPERGSKHIKQQKVQFSIKATDSNDNKGKSGKTKSGSRKSVNDTLVRENLSNLYRKQARNDESTILHSEKSQRQVNIDLKKKIIEIFLVYVKYQTNQHIENIIRHIRQNSQRMQFVDESKIYEDMKQPTNIESIFPTIDLPIPIYTTEGKDTVLKEKRKRNKKRDNKGNDDEPQYPPLNSFLIHSSPAFVEAQAKIEKPMKQAEELLFNLLNIFLTNNDYQLNCLVLNLIFKNFSLGKQAIKESKNLVILSDEIENELDNKIEETIVQFSFMCETSETWFVHAARLKLLENDEWMRNNPEEYQFLMEKKTQVQVSIQQIKDLNELMFTVSLRDMQYPARNLQKKEVKRNRQFMMKNVNAQKLIMDMLKDNIHILEEITEFDNTCNITKVFIHCFEFLRNFCLRDNKINKKDLYNEINFFLRFMKYVEVGQAELINEIYKDNYKACTEVDDTVIKLYLAKICHPQSSKGYGGRHIRYINFIYNIMFFKKLKMPINNNIWKVVQNIQISMNSERMVQFLFMKKNEPSENKIRTNDAPIKRYTGEYILDLSFPDSIKLKNNGSQEKTSLDLEDYYLFNQPYIYHAGILNLLFDITEETKGRSSFLKNSLRRYLSMEYLLFFLQKQDYFHKATEKNKLVLTLKKPLCRIFILLYGDLENMQTNQKRIIDNDDTKAFIDSELFKLKQEIQQKRFMHVYSKEFDMSNLSQSPNNRSSYQQFYKYQSVDWISRNEGVEEYKDLSEEDQMKQNQTLEPLSQYIDKNALDYQNWLIIYSLPMINFILELDEKIRNKFEFQRQEFETLLEQYGIDNHFKSLSLREHISKENIEQIQSKTNKIIFKQKDNNNQTVRLKSTNNDVQSSIILNDDLEQYVSLPLQNILSNKDSGKQFNEQYPKIFLLNMLIMEEFKKEIELERSCFISSVMKIDKILVEGKGDKRSVILPRMTQFLKTTFNQYTIDKGWNEYRIMVEIMRVFISILENPLDQYELKQISKLSGKEMDEELLEEEESQKRTMYQDLLASHNLPKILLEMLCSKDIDYKLHHQSIKLSRVIFLLLNSLLMDGNRKVQGQAYEYFTTSPYSQAFFDMISDMIDDEIKQTLNVSIYDDIEKDLENIEFVYRSKDKFMSITDVLKTLQNLCEGHFTKNQNYIRQQTNSRNSVNLIQRLTELFNVVIRDPSEPNKLKIDIVTLLKASQILDTLTEAIQGPVLDNQLELIQTKILKSICEILMQEENMKFSHAHKIKDKIHSSKTKLNNLQNAKQAKMHDDKKKIQDKLIENLRKLSYNFAQIVSSNFYKSKEGWMIAKLKNKCTQFLDSLLEGNQDSTILTKIMQEIPQTELSRNLGLVYEKFKKSQYTDQLLQISYFEIEEIAKMPSDREQYGRILDTGFRLYHLLVLYHQESSKTQSKEEQITKEALSLQKNQKNINESYDYFKKITLHIEVNIGSQFYVIYFPKLPACEIDYTQILKKYEDLFNRLSTKSKTRDLLKYKEDIILELNHEYSIHDQSKEKDQDLEDKNLVLANIAMATGFLKWFSTWVIKNSHQIQSASFNFVIK